MKEFLPTRIQSDRSVFFSGLEFKSFYFKSLNEHLTAIESLAHKKPSALLERLLTGHFDNQLKILDPVLYHRWQKSRSFAHLTTVDILRLIQEEIPPLKHCYSLMKEIADANNDEASSTWFSTQKKLLMTEVAENIKRLVNLECHLKNELLFRCQISTALKEPSHFDDVVIFFYRKLKDLKLLNFTESSIASACLQLNGDRRLLIYDLLKGSEHDKSDRFQSIIQPLFPKRAYKSLRSANEIKTTLKETYQFCSEVLSDLNLISLRDHLLTLRLKSDFFRRLRRPGSLKEHFQAAIKLLKNFSRSWGWEKFFKKLWQLRFLIYLALTLYIQSSMTKSIKPLFLLVFSKAAFVKLSSVLFYSIGLAPLWYVGWQLVKKSAIELQKILTQRKVEEILSSLIHVEKAELFLAAYLSPSIIDIAHYDIDYLTKQSETVLTALKISECQLKNYRHKMEAWLCQGMLQNKIHRVINRINNQEKRINEQLKLFAENIAVRIGEEIELLIGDLRQTKLVPLLSPEQVKSLRGFVARYGGQEVLETFTQNANIIQRWILKIEKYKYSYLNKATNSAPENRLNLPWGCHAIRHDYANGWKIILTAFIDDEETKKNCCRLNDFLAGNSQLTLKQCEEILGKINLSAAKQLNLLKKIQLHVFNTLSERPPESAALISTEKKEVITQWYHQYQKEILAAKQLYTTIFSQPQTDHSALLRQLTDAKLNEYYKLLSGLDIYAYSQNHQEQSEIQTLAYQFFFKNKGQSIEDFRLIKYVPQALKTKIIPQFAMMRLVWLLNNLETLPEPFSFTPLEESLFNHPLLAGTQFSFAQIVINHPRFNESYQEKMVSFLRACEAILFKGSLLKKYCEIHNKSPFAQKNWLPSRQSTSKSCKLSVVENKKSTIFEMRGLHCVKV